MTVYITLDVTRTSKALVSVKFLPNRLVDYSDDALVTEIRRVAEIDPARTVLPATEFASLARVGLTTIRRRFRDWRSALAAAGLSHLYKEVAPARISRVEGRGWTEREVVEEVQAGVLKQGRELEHSSFSTCG